MVNKKRYRKRKRQNGGAFGAGIAAGMALPLILGAAGKILPGIFGKRKQQTTNNHYGSNQSRPPQSPQYYRPQYRPQYYQPPPQYYRPQYYRPQQQYYNSFVCGNTT